MENRIIQAALVPSPHCEERPVFLGRAYKEGTSEDRGADKGSWAVVWAGVMVANTTLGKSWRLKGQSLRIVGFEERSDLRQV